MTLEEEVWAWIRRVSVVREDLSHLPACPFARAAWLHDGVAVHDHTRRGHHPDTAVDLAARDWRAHQRVALVVFGPMPVTDLMLAAQLGVLPHTDFIALPDHPDMPFILPGFDTALGRPCVVIQPRIEFVRARASLRRHGYYANWTEEALAAVGATR